MSGDDDIEFDFFEDEPARADAPAQRPRLPRRPAGRPRGGSPLATAPLLRLILLVGLVVFLVLVFGLLVQSCATSSRHEAYARYMEDVATIAASSVADGKVLATTLTAQGLSVAQIETKLRGIAAQEQQNVARARSLDPPGRLRDENLHVIEALELRVSGVDGLATAFQATARSKSTTADSETLARQALRLTASDVVWDDLFKAPAAAQMEHDGVSGVDVPDSHFVANPSLMNASSMALVLNITPQDFVETKTERVDELP